ncbi:MAG: hypothetical protein R3F30_01090 [Planctomycetota bacterium]
MRTFALALGLLVAPATAQLSANKDPVAPTPRIAEDGSNLLQVLAMTFDRVPMLGDRVWYQAVPQDQGPPRIVRYQERIAVRPKPAGLDPERPGDFALTLLAAGELGTQMSASEVSLRQAAFRDHAGFLHYQRDFRVHDVRAAEANYRVAPMGSILKNGRVGRLFDLIPVGEGRSSYRLLVDQAEQVVLDWVEFDGQGRFVAAMGYEKGLALGAGVTFPGSTQWWKPWVELRRHDDVGEAGAVLGFEVRTPETLPRGYALLSVRSARERTLGIDYAVLVYTDGLRNFYLCESSSSATVGVLDPGTSPQQLVTVKRYRIGPVVQYLADYKGRSTLLFGDFGEPVGDANKVPQLLQQVIR